MPRLPWPAALARPWPAARTGRGAGRLELGRRRRALDQERQRELVDPQGIILGAGRRNGFDLHELGLREPGRGLDVAHQGRDPRVRLRVADQRDLGPDLAEQAQIDTIRKLPDHLVEHVDGLGAVGLQRLHHLLAREQRLRLLAQPVDFLDLLVELRDLFLEQLVAATLVVDARGDHHVN
jgi:hypothetical protein